MLHAFLDESYSDDWFFIAAAVGDDRAVTQFEDAVQWLLIDLAEFHACAPLPEIHGYELLQGKGPWKAITNIQTRIDIACRVLQLADQHGIDFIIRGLDREAQRRRYADPYEPYSLMLTHTIRAIDEYAARRRTRVEVLCDEYSEHDRHRAMLNRHRANGTPGYSRSNLQWVAGDLEFVRSCDRPMIQVADLVAYLKHRAIRQPEVARAEQRSRRRMWNLIQPRLHQDYIWVP